jgi:hypothetical protein
MRRYRVNRYKTIAEIILHNGDVGCGWAVLSKHGANLKERSCCRFSAESLGIDLRRNFTAQPELASDPATDRFVATEMAGIGF